MRLYLWRNWNWWNCIFSSVQFGWHWVFCTRDV